jgi:hypothetical protein
LHSIVDLADALDANEQVLMTLCCCERSFATALR